MALDIQLFHLLNNLAGQSPFFDNIIVFFAEYLAYLLIALFLALLFFSLYPKREKLEILLVTGSSAFIARFGVAEVIRLFIHRPRPFLAMPVHQLITDSAWSFPSGHATFFFAMATAVYLYHKKWGAFFFVAAIFVTAGRVMAGVHYPSDIIGGALIGILTAYAVFAVTRKLFPPRGLQNTISTY
ncbi:MAG: phosphatase PAP2 family protein [Patescibacteria group bacterium]|nr:phosphatase PAP2 family protein [Patescibacteria group bacterium]